MVFSLVMLTMAKRLNLTLFFFYMVIFKCRFDLNLHILAQAVLVDASM